MPAVETAIAAPIQWPRYHLARHASETLATDYCESRSQRPLLLQPLRTSQLSKTPNPEYVAYAGKDRSDRLGEYAQIDHRLVCDDYTK